MRFRLGPITLLAAACAAALGASTALAGEEVANGNSTLQIKLTMLGRYDSGIRGASGAEIVQHDPLSQRLFTVNAQAKSVDVISIADPASPTLVGTISETLGNANSVAVHQGLVAVAFEAPVKTDLGSVVFYSAQTLEKLATFQVGALPDMLTFMPDGEAVLVANEGEPNAGYTIDPVGSVSVIDLRWVENRLNGPELQALGQVRTADFTAFNPEIDDLRKTGVRIYGPGADVAHDLEPEYIAVAHDGRSAWVSLQEANSIGVLDLSDLGAPYFSDILPLGLKDHSLPGNELDASDRDPRNAPTQNIRNWPVYGLYEPDAIASYAIKGKTYYVLANEGDDRNDWVDPDETGRVKDLVAAGQIDTTAFTTPADLSDDARLGRLTVTTAQVPRKNGKMTELHALGGRSFSVRSDDGTLLFDSGSQLERITAAYPGGLFNTSNDNNTLEDRSDNKGPEPEGVAVGKIRGRTFAFIGLERFGGIAAYDVTNPKEARYVDYINTRNFAISPTAPKPSVTDAGPEGVAFISADDSPNGKPMIVVGNEISGTTLVLGLDVTGK